VTSPAFQPIEVQVQQRTREPEPAGHSLTCTRRGQRVDHPQSLRMSDRAEQGEQLDLVR